MIEQALADSRLSETELLPLYQGWDRTIFITAKGEFLYRDEENVLRPEHDPSTQLMALVAGAEQFEALVNLLPQRPLDPENCPACGGRGTIAGPVFCPECHGLGWPARFDAAQWTRELERPVACYPPFDEAVRKFAAFAEAEVVFVSDADIATVRRTAYLRIPDQSEAREQARNAYRAAARRRLGVAIRGRCRLPDGRIAASIDAPKSAAEAVELLYPDGLKMSVPVDVPAAVVIGPLRLWLLQRMRASSASAAM